MDSNVNSTSRSEKNKQENFVKSSCYGDNGASVRPINTGGQLHWHPLAKQLLAEASTRRDKNWSTTMVINKNN